MPDLHSWEDEAARYLLGELSNVQRAEFEARLASSPELRALIRELEEGAVALSMTSPRQLPPPETWQRIEKGIASGMRVVRLPASWIGWCRSGWAAAAACLIGWILYAFWVNRSASSNAGSATAHHAPAQPTVAESPAREERAGQPSPSTAIDPKDEMLATRLRTIERLRAQLRDVENQNTQLSRSFTQQQAMLAENGRLKFVQLAPPGNADGDGSTRRLSPELQRVLFLAMARELGWITAGETDGVRNNTADPLGVDFVDLRPGTNRVANPPEFQRNEAAANATGGGPNTQTAGGGIPAFVLGDSMVLALDTSLAPSGSVVTVSTGPVGQSQQPVGTMVLGDNPVAVLIPFASTSANGQTVTVRAFSAGGSSVIGQFSTPTAIHP